MLEELNAKRLLKEEFTSYIREPAPKSIMICGKSNNMVGERRVKLPAED